VPRFDEVEVIPQGDLVRIECPPLHYEWVHGLRASIQGNTHALVRRPEGVSFLIPASKLDAFRAAYERGFEPTLAMPARVIVYYDYVSPYAYLATRLVDMLEAEYDVHVEWRGLELRPEWVQFPAWWGESEASRQRWIERREAVRRYGLPMRDTRPPFRPRTRPLLMASEHAKRRGRFRPFQQAVFEAYYGGGEDIRAWPVVESIAARVGLDPAEMRAAVVEGRYEPTIESWRREAEADHIFGVPTFKVGSWIIWGRETLDDVRQALDRCGASRRGQGGGGDG
jgi:2-hydroxychromene-2-carboxylate isomerase